MNSHPQPSPRERHPGRRPRPVAIGLVAGALLLGLACQPGPSAGQAPGSAPPQATPPPGQAPGGGAAGAGGWQGAPGAGRTGRQTVVTVQVETARFDTLRAENTTAGAVVPDTQSAVAAGSSGTVKTILRQAGEWVKAGDPVIRLDDAQLQLTLKISQANLRNARITAGLAENGSVSPDSRLSLQLSSAQKTYNSALALSKIGGISDSDLDTAQANLQAARAAVDQGALAVETAVLQVQQAQLNLNNAVIRAPYDGQISAVNLHPGEYVGASTTAFSLVSRKKVISFGVSPADGPGLALGTGVRFLYGGRSYSTTITQAPSAPVNGVVSLTADLPPTVQAPLGAVGTVIYQLPLAQGVIVSLASLQSAENKTFVYTVAEGKAARKEATVLAESGSQAAVLGIAPGVAVVLNPPPGLLPGTALKVAGGPEAKAGEGATPPAAGAAAGSRRPGQGGEASAAPEGGRQGQGTGTGQRRRPSTEAGAPGPGTPAPAPGGQ